MKPSRLDQVVDAVLYEGYILYPYRASSKKNQQRFTFGRVYPQAYSVAQDGVEPFVMQTECLARCQTESPVLEIRIRFLHPMAREVGSLSNPGPGLNGSAASSFQVVPALRVDGDVFQTWQEAVEREVKLPPLQLSQSLPSRRDIPFSFPASQVMEPIRDQRGCTVGMMRRRQEAIEGRVEIVAEPVAAEVFKISARILNQTPVAAEELEKQDVILMRTFASTHTILRIAGGEFISLMDPPSAWQPAANRCQNIGTWPVLVGDEEKGERDTLLSSPIILADYPRIAPESSGNLFDGTEIDEILTLRIMTMTEEEKREMRLVDEHARRLLERTEGMGEDHLLKMHGVMRANRSFDENVFGTSTRLEGVSVNEVYLQAGNLVRIRPKGRADVMDMALAGKTAMIEAVELDAEGRVHLAVVLQDDPGKDLGLLRQPGHRFFYGVDEIEPLREAT
ncbi:MAG: hypothetical protein JWR19_1864 [Pedosphaera sp.]|nr:hypothetical protein [Pedosphaera sp.]